ncbi:MAG: cation:proton antiporter [Gammaproteobacteria bacterium]|nr:cation:proton antiporter [Gammaproteobacteria bacterium]
MNSTSAAFLIFVIFAGAAVLATLALLARQAMIVAYIVVGMLLGPSGLAVVNDAAWLQDIADIGILFLLYLLGLNMVPRQLLKMLREAVVVVCLSSLVFFCSGVAVALAYGFTPREALVIGAAMMFSSTIIGLKLLPTTTLHHQHIGQVLISVLLLQDLLAILVLLGLQASANSHPDATTFSLQLLALPVLIGVAYGLERWVLEPLLARFDQIQEYLFLVVIAWCLSIAELASRLGLSHEIGAFIAGVALANCPVSLFIADSLRPLRDFFLILFFFSVGASLELGLLAQTLLPALTLAALMLVAKPWVFQRLFVREQETPALAREAGVRLGQISEFSLLIAVLATQIGLLGSLASNVLQLAVVLTLVASSYFIVMRYPTPMAVRDDLRRD